MSFYDDASLVFLPSGQAGKDGKAYSMKPTNGDGDFTFSRGSNLTATRVDSNGLIEKGRENLLLQSNSFDTTWIESNASATNGQSGYDGSTDAWKLEADSDGSGRRINQSITQSGVFVFSVYVKAGTTDFIRLNLNGAGNCFFNISESSSSVLTSSNVNLVGSIQAIGDGWNRCSLLNLTGSSITEVRINLASGDNDLSAVTGDNIYIQDAQLEQGLVATEYIESGASTGLAGILEDSPRFDYSGGATCPSLLLEPSRTNLVEYSEYIEGNTSQGFTNATKEGFTESPEGLNNAYEINVITPNENAAYDLGRFNTTIGADYTYSVYLKSSGTFDARIYAARGTTEVKNIVVTSEWQRFDLTFTSDNADKDLIVGFGDFNFANPAQTISIYGLQFENATYPTSYIPNHSGGSVTREAEKQEITGLTSSVLNQNDGSFYIELQTLSTDSGRVVITSYPAGASNDTIRFIFGSNIQFGLVSALGLTDSTNPSSAKVKVVGTYSRSELKLCVNGGSVQQSSGSFAFANQPTKLYTHAFVDTIRAFANIDKIIYFPSVLSDNEMITLTS